MAKEIVEYRGIEGLVYAEVLSDTADELTFGEVKALCGVATLSKTTQTSSEAHYYDNIPAVVVDGTGADEVTMGVSAIPFDVLADITGQYYDGTLGAFVEGERESKYFALGYKTSKTNGDDVYVWRYKGTFSIPNSDHNTKDDGTEGTGQELTYTGINTTHKFVKTGKTAKALNVDLGKDLADVSTFFDQVTTHDDLKPKA